MADTNGHTEGRDRGNAGLVHPGGKGSWEDRIDSVPSDDAWHNRNNRSGERDEGAQPGYGGNVPR